MSGQEHTPLDQLHGLTADAGKGRYKCRITIRRHKKFVGKRIMVHLPTVDPAAAMFGRDAILNFCVKIGLSVVRRGQKRPVKEGGHHEA